MKKNNLKVIQTNLHLSGAPAKTAVANANADKKKKR